MDRNVSQGALFLAAVLTTLFPGGSCILCPAGVECQNEVCLSSRGQTACCTCVDWDSKGACVIWVSPQGLREPQCNFEVDEPVINADEAEAVGNDECPFEVECEEERCVIVNGHPSCCRCSGWLPSGMCRPDRWWDQEGNACLLPDENSISTPSVVIPPEVSLGCPVGVNCEDTLCRIYNGASTCCTCTRWQSTGSCHPTGWRGQGGKGQCILFTEQVPINREPEPQQPLIHSPVSSGSGEMNQNTSNQQDHGTPTPGHGSIVAAKGVQVTTQNCNLGGRLCRTLGTIATTMGLSLPLKN